MTRRIEAVSADAPPIRSACAISSPICATESRIHIWSMSPVLT